MTNQEVLSAFTSSQDGKSNNLTSLRGKLYSYGLVIAEREIGFTKVFDYRAGSGNFVSVTTSKHVAQVIAACLQENIPADIQRP